MFRHGDVSQITKAAEVGMYVHGLFLEGARWDTENSCLADAAPMELTSSMPIIHFKPIDTKKQLKGTFSCPLYLYPIRTGTRERPSFIFMTALDLKSGSTLAMRYRLGRRTARDRSVSRLCTCSFLSSLILAWGTSFIR